jgi:hypothetical protein
MRSNATEVCNARVLAFSAATRSEIVGWSRRSLEAGDLQNIILVFLHCRDNVPELEKRYSALHKGPLLAHDWAFHSAVRFITPTSPETFAKRSILILGKERKNVPT